MQTGGALREKEKNKNSMLIALPMLYFTWQVNEIYTYDFFISDDFLYVCQKVSKLPK